MDREITINYRDGSIQSCNVCGTKDYSFTPNGYRPEAAGVEPGGIRDLRIASQSMSLCAPCARETITVLEAAFSQDWPEPLSADEKAKADLAAEEAAMAAKTRERRKAAGQVREALLGRLVRVEDYLDENGHIDGDGTPGVASVSVEDYLERNGVIDGDGTPGVASVSVGGLAIGMVEKVGSEWHATAGTGLRVEGTDVDGHTVNACSKTRKSAAAALLYALRDGWLVCD